MECPACHTSVDASQRFCPTCGIALAPTEAQVQEDAMIGHTLGDKYKIVRRIGEGGMGAVYEGEQQLGSTKRKVAVKTLHPHLSRDPKIKARFEREVGTVAELEHPNTIQVYDFGSSSDGILYIVMEFLQGKSLAALLEHDGAMPPDRVERIMQQICGSLEEAHARGIVHRDLKPDNVVLVNRAGQKDFVKVLDFGIAKRAQEVDGTEQKLTQQGMVLGTPPYMSPEQFTGRPIDARSDIYSLGVLAYEMLTGKLPFEANTPWEWASQHMTHAPIPIESLTLGMRAPEAMRGAIKRCLAKLPEQRFQTVQSFFDAFSGSPAEQSAAVAPAAGRQKTEVGTPLDVAAALGASRQGVPATMGGPIPAFATPIANNGSSPTPAAIPRPPLRQDGRGKGRSALLVTAGLVCVASIGAIAIAMRGSSGGSKGVVFDPAGPTAPAASPASSAIENTATAASPSLSAASYVPPLSGGGVNGHGSPHQASSHAPSGGAPPGPGPSPAPSPAAHGPAMPGPAAPGPAAPGPAAPGPAAPGPAAPGPAAPGPAAPSPTVLGPAAAPVPAPSPPKYDGAECATARRLRGLGHPKEAESWALACIAKGGIP